MKSIEKSLSPPDICLFGGTGLVGHETLNQLTQICPELKILSVSRRSVNQDPKNFDECIIQDFANNLEKSMPPLSPSTTIIWALGSTIKQAGSRERFRDIDYKLAIQAAKFAKKQGVRTFILVSAAGASPHSKFFYNRVKGDLEQELITLGFDNLAVLRPSLILGSRSESRPGETLGKIFLEPIRHLFTGPLSGLRPVHYTEIAKTIVTLVHEQKSGTFFINSKEIRDIAMSG